MRSTMRALLIVLVCALLAPAFASRRANMLTPATRFKSTSLLETSAKSQGCASIMSCNKCTAISFCLWHSRKGGCVADSSVPKAEMYDYFQGSCGHSAGDWQTVPGVDSAHGQMPLAFAAKMKGELPEDDFTYKPLMMQPPAIANQDEEHIFQGAFPRPDYGQGELGYKLQGLDANHIQHNNEENDVLMKPRHACPTPLSGCLEKPVIVPSGAVKYGEYGPPGEPTELA